jgi:hypothetical protein
MKGAQNRKIKDLLFRCPQCTNYMGCPYWHKAVTCSHCFSTFVLIKENPRNQTIEVETQEVFTIGSRTPKQYPKFWRDDNGNRQVGRGKGN